MKASQKLKQRSLRKVQQAAKEIEALLQEGTVQDDSAKIRQRLDDMLEGDEYFVLVTREGLGIIHTNRLREGTLFNDAVYVPHEPMNRWHKCTPATPVSFCWTHQYLFR